MPEGRFMPKAIHDTECRFMQPQVAIHSEARLRHIFSRTGAKVYCLIIILPPSVDFVNALNIYAKKHARKFGFSVDFSCL